MLTKTDTTDRPRDYDRPPGEYTFRAASHRAGTKDLAEALLAADWLLFVATEYPEQATAIVAGVRKAVRGALRATRPTRRRTAVRCARKAVRK